MIHAILGLITFICENGNVQDSSATFSNAISNRFNTFDVTMQNGGNK